MKIKLQQVRHMPQILEAGILYVSEEFEIAMHLCPCGCGAKISTPLGPTDWKITYTSAGPSLYPSIGNWQNRANPIIGSRMATLFGVVNGARHKFSRDARKSRNGASNILRSAVRREIESGIRFGGGWLTWCVRQPYNPTLPRLLRVTAPIYLG
jgi:hypothetical protein